MRDLWIWYLTIEALGWASVPLALSALPSLPDRGWSLSKTLGMLLVGFGVWFPLALFSGLPYRRGWIIMVALVYVAINLTLLVYVPGLRGRLRSWLTSQRFYVLAGEGIFAAVFGVMAWLRSYAPQIEGTEKFMDQAFIASIMRAGALPPPDPWLAGYPINYYYFGHFLIGNFARMLGTSPDLAFNLGVCLTAALVAVGVYGVVANLCALIFATRTAAGQSGTAPGRAPRYLLHGGVFGTFAVVATLVFGNLTSFGNLFGKLGGAHIALLTWLNRPALWSGYDWWYPSRAIPNTITEFPDFSFMLSDLHAHVIAFPYTILAISIALNLWLMPRLHGLYLFGDRLRRLPVILVAGVTIGSLYAMNGWDLPTYFGLILLAIILHQWETWHREVSRDLLLAIVKGVAAIGVVAIGGFLPFLWGFTSPSQGIGIYAGSANHQAIPFSAPQAIIDANPGARTAVQDWIGAGGVMLIIAATWIVVLTARSLIQFFQHTPSRSLLPPVGQLRFSVDTGKTGEIVTSKVAATGMVTMSQPEAWLRAWGTVIIGAVILVTTTWATWRWDVWTFIWSMLLLLGATIAVITVIGHQDHYDEAGMVTVFPVLLIALGAGLMAACEVVYLKDVFGPGALERMNTVFKFYFQAWLLLAIGGTAGLAWMTMHLRDALPGILAKRYQPLALFWRGAWVVSMGVLVALVLIYPLATARARYGIGVVASTGTLNGLTSRAGSLPLGDIHAVHWLQTHVGGSPVILEATSRESEYSPYYARISTYTGLPAVLGWQGHEIQWRYTWLQDPVHQSDFGARLTDTTTLYTSSDQALVRSLLRHYHVQYIYVGDLEWQTYGGQADLTRLATYPFLTPVYQADGVTIYHVV